MGPCSKIGSLPAYTTLLCQAFSPVGDHLAVGSDRGRLALYQVSDLISGGRKSDPSAPSPLYWDVEGSVNALVSTQGYLVAGVSHAKTNTSEILAWAWKDILKYLNHGATLIKPKVFWSIDGGNLPTDVNALLVDADGTAGRIFVAGGTCGSSNNNLDYAIRVIDLETRAEVTTPLKGHQGYLHDISLNEESRTLASASEDGSVKIWDLSQAGKKGSVQEIIPHNHQKLSRPRLGRWIGAVSLCGELLCCGGGPRPAVYHLRTLTPVDSDGLQLPASTEQNGALHVLQIFPEDNRIVAGGEFQGHLYQTNMSGELLAEIETSSSCTYSVARTSSDTQKLLSCAGSSSEIDLCTANFSYKDRTISFPTMG